MTHPEGAGRWLDLRAISSMRSEAVASALGITYRELDCWLRAGIVKVASIKPTTGEPMTGPGSRRQYSYPTILQLGLGAKLHMALGISLERVIERVRESPEGFDSWGSAIEEHGDIRRHPFSFAVYGAEELELVSGREDLLGHLVDGVGAAVINLSSLRTETDDGIRRVLSTGE